MKNWQLYHFLDVRKILGAASLNFIRFPRVVITPTVTTLLRGENDSKRSDEVQAKERQASKKFYNKCSENSRSQIVSENGRWVPLFNSMRFVSVARARVVGVD